MQLLFLGLEYSMVPLSIYLHFPWCLRKCPYCDFNSYPLEQQDRRKEYVAALIRDFKHDLPHVQGRKIVSIYLGGGTPSLFDAQQIAKILNAVAQDCTLENNLEVTMEANPGTLTRDKCYDLHALGVNRLSLGVQSLQNKNLALLGRIYRQSQVLRTLDFVARQFKNFNVDLLFGLPHQTVKSALNDLSQTLCFKPQHISWYQLTIEEGSQFYAKPPPLPQAERIWQIQEMGQKFLHTHGFKQYEVSAYNKTGHACRHNVNYWQFGDYLGIGAGAHSKITLADKIIRFNKWSKPQDYLTKETFIAAQEILSAQQLPFEFMLNALRLYRPIPLALFKVRTGLPISAISSHLKAAKDLGLLRVAKRSIIVTHKGHNFLNDLLELFLR